jgi:SNF2 family DNA or RNA helicase
VDSSEDDRLRFRPSQALLLDALLEERQARVRVDKGFSTWRIGGCLTDDMALGETVQVLALLASVRTKAEHPSIVVVPKSLGVQWAGRGSEVHATAQNP